MADYINGPVELRLLQPQDQDGNPLNDTNASATVTIYDEALNVVVATNPMVWMPAANTWVYVFDPTGRPGGLYRAHLLLTPTGGLAQPQWRDLNYDASPTVPPGPQPEGVFPASQHWLSPWCSDADIPKGRLIDSNGTPISDVPVGLAISAATNLLYVLSGRKFRSGRSVVRPAAIVPAASSGLWLYPYSSMSGYGSAWGFAAGWSWSALGPGWWASSMEQTQVILQGPVTAIRQVLVDGVPLDPTAYTLYEGRRLVRNSGGAWPWQQDLSLPITMPGTWQIDYEWGNPVGEDGRVAAIQLAIEIILGLSGQDSCRLAPRALSVATQGVNQGVGDPLDYLREQMTGLPLVDMFLAAHNPHKRRRRAVFLGPNSVLGRAT